MPWSTKAEACFSSPALLHEGQGAGAVGVSGAKPEIDEAIGDYGLKARGEAPGRRVRALTQAGRNLVAIL